ncbi:MAG: hypothetical protein ACKO38_04385 [Planctomycetota bacterium]
MLRAADDPQQTRANQAAGHHRAKITPSWDRRVQGQLAIRGIHSQLAPKRIVAARWG